MLDQLRRWLDEDIALTPLEIAMIFVGVTVLTLFALISIFGI